MGRRIPKTKTLYTRQGQKVEVVTATQFWIFGLIEGKMQTWYRKGFFVDERINHPMDIDWAKV